MINQYLSKPHLKKARTFLLKRLGNREFLVPLIGLALIIIVAISLNIYLVAQDKRPPPYDYAGYLSSSIDSFHAVKSGSFSQFIISLSNPYRPPLIPILALPFYFIFGTSFQSAMLINVFFLIILILCIYKLTKIVTQSTSAGLLAAGIIWAIPGVLAYDRVFGLDFPTTALVSAGLYLTIASKGFSQRNKYLALGVVIGLGMLTKWSYFVFVAPIIAIEMIRCRRNLNLKNILILGIIAGMITLPWYIYALRHGLIQSLFHFSWGEGAKGYSASSNVFDSTSLLFYPKAIFTHLMGPIYGIGLLSIFGLVLVIMIIHWKSGHNHVNKSLLLSLLLSFLIPLAIFTILEDKSVRFFLPAVPCLSVLLVWAGFKIRIRGIKVGAFLLAILVITGSFLSLFGSLHPVLGARVSIYDPWTVSDTTFDYNDYSPPQSYDWKVEDVLKYISSVNGHATIGVLTNHWVYNQDTLHYYAIRIGYDDLNFRDFRNAQVVSPYDNLNIYDIVIIKTENVGVDWDTVSLRKILENLKDPKNQFYAEHELIQSYDLPDGSQLLIYKKKVNLSNNLLSNSSFEVGDPPTGWNAWQSKISQNGTYHKLGNYSMNVRISNGNDGSGLQSLTNYDSYANQTMTFNAWVWCAEYNAAYLQVTDGKNYYNSDFHPGDSKWHWLTVTGIISSNPSRLIAGCFLHGRMNASAYVDDANLIVVSSTP